MSGGSKQKIGILVVDGQAVFRDGLAMRLNRKKDFAASAETKGSVSVTELIRRHNPDTLFYDVGHAIADGIEALKEIRQKSKESNGCIPVIAISEIHARSAVKSFLDAGGMGYVLKTSPIEEYVEAIRKSLRGEKHVCKELFAEIFMEDSSAEQITYNGFTKERKAALRLFARKLPIKEIAAELKITPDAVRHHIRESITAFNVNSPIELYDLLQTLELD